MIYFKPQNSEYYSSKTVYVPYLGTLTQGFANAGELNSNGAFAISIDIGTTKPGALSQYRVFADWTVGKELINGSPEIEEIKFFTNFKFKDGVYQSLAYPIKYSTNGTFYMQLVAPYTTQGSSQAPDARIGNARAGVIIANDNTMEYGDLKGIISLEDLLAQLRAKIKEIDKADDRISLTDEEVETAVKNAMEYYVPQYGYQYFVTFSLRDNDTYHDDLDIRGKVTLAKTPTSARDNFNEGTTHYADVKFGGVNNNASKYIDFNGDIMDLEFDGTLFTVDTNGKKLGDMRINNNSDFNDAIGKMYPRANMAFFSWNNSKNTTFNKSGSLYFFLDDNAITKTSKVYEILSDGTLKELKSEYDDDFEALKIRTRTLGSYVISDIELVAEGETTTDAPENSEKPTIGDVTTKPNPSTGR